MILNNEVRQKFDSYPENVVDCLMRLRQLILLVSEEDNLSDLQETLKWGEPSYVAPNGSTIRYAWKRKTPDHYFVFFNCKTTLIETFKEIYSDTFVYEGNRAIIFHVKDVVPSKELKHCISMALNYHKIKHLPLLGA